MQDLIVRNLKLVKGGSAINKRTGAPIGRPRTRAPRKAIRESLEPAELKLLEAPRLYLVASEAEAAIPPFQRLSRAQQAQITYAKQQPRITRTIADQRDQMIHSEQVLGWRVEIWQKGETRGTDKPLYFYRTENLTLGARGGQNRRNKYEYLTPQEALKAGRSKAGERERLWRGRGRYTSALPQKKRRRWRGGYIAPSRTDTKLIDAITSCECPVDAALCPICRKQIERNNYAVRSHLRPHVRSGLIQSRQAEEIVGFLVVPAHSSNVIYHGSL